MDGAPLGLLVIAAFLALAAWWHYAMYRRARRSPLWLAFGATTGALLFLVAGILGYNLSKASRSLTGMTWSETVIWWQVCAGLLLAAIAVVYWRKGLRSIRQA